MTAKISSQNRGNKATMCIDGNERSGLCLTGREKAPWLVIDYGSSVKIRGIVIIPWHGHEYRAKNLEVRVADEMPVKGQLFTNGQRLGSSEGPVPRNWNIDITSESGAQLHGRYLVLQSNYGPVHRGRGEHLGLQEVRAWGKGR